MPALRSSHVPRVAALLLATAFAGQAIAGPEEDKRAANAVRVLSEIQQIPEQGIPDKLLDEGRAIVVIPDTLKVGLVIGTGVAGMIGNIIWLVVAGFWLALAHLLAAVASAVTIIGIPFAWQHVKLAGMSLAPIGITIVDKHVAEEARRRWAAGEVERLRR